MLICCVRIYWERERKSKKNLPPMKYNLTPVQSLCVIVRFNSLHNVQNGVTWPLTRLHLCQMAWANHYVASKKDCIPLICCRIVPASIIHAIFPQMKWGGFSHILLYDSISFDNQTSTLFSPLFLLHFFFCWITVDVKRDQKHKSFMNRCKSTTIELGAIFWKSFDFLCYGSHHSKNPISKEFDGGLLLSSFVCIELTWVWFIDEMRWIKRGLDVSHLAKHRKTIPISM